MTKYVAFLRGINVGGRNLIKMERLRKSFEALGFEKVKTILASGNVLFETKESDSVALAETIEEKLKQEYRREIGVIIRTIEDIQELADAEPFKDLDAAAETKLYVTFLSHRSKSVSESSLESPNKGTQVVRVLPREVCSAVDPSANWSIMDLMGMLEKKLGNVTTRNWNTIGRVLKG